MLCWLAIFFTGHRNAALGSSLGKTSSQGNRFFQGQTGLKLEATRGFDFATDKKLAVFNDGNTDSRVNKVAFF